MENWQLQRHWVQMLIGFADVSTDLATTDGELVACATEQLLQLQSSLRGKVALSGHEKGHFAATLLLLQRWSGAASM